MFYIVHFLQTKTHDWLLVTKPEDFLRLLYFTLLLIEVMHFSLCKKSCLRAKLISCHLKL